MMGDIDKNFVADIYKQLPGRNCGLKGESPCGLETCVKFAVELSQGFRQVSDCPYLEDENLQSIVLLLEEYFR
jgi:ArsR family metal-binding transcriptional regulator